MRSRSLALRVQSALRRATPTSTTDRRVRVSVSPAVRSEGGTLTLLVGPPDAVTIACAESTVRAAPRNADLHYRAESEGVGESGCEEQGILPIWHGGQRREDVRDERSTVTASSGHHPPGFGERAKGFAKPVATDIKHARKLTF